MESKQKVKPNYKRIFMAIAILAILIVSLILIIVSAGKNRTENKSIQSNPSVKPETPVVSCYSKNGKTILVWEKDNNAKKYTVSYEKNGKWKKLGDTKDNTFAIDAKNCKYTLFSVRGIGSKKKSDIIPVMGMYIDYTYRSKDRSMAGCGSFCKAEGLDLAQQKALLRYINAYYTSIGSFEPQAEKIYADRKTLDKEMSLVNSVIAVRTHATEDLSMTRYRFVLNAAKVTKESENSISVTVIESCNFQFRDIPVISQTYNNKHTFKLLKEKKGKWGVSEHSSESSPFYNFEYDPTSDKDMNLEKALECITERQAVAGSQNTENPYCDHPYDRTAAKEYMMKWIDKRNPNRHAYDTNGGNCMNFASQIMYAGGIKQNESWYWKGEWDFAPAWIRVGDFEDYAAAADDNNLYCDTEANYYTGNVGDIILMGIKDTRSHATVISDIIKNEKGETIDYLLCCNTTNLKNFPAAAYHYTNQHLIRIYGRND